MRALASAKFLFTRQYSYRRGDKLFQEINYFICECSKKTVCSSALASYRDGNFIILPHLSMGRLLTGATNLGRHWWHWICRVLYMRPLVLSGFDAEGDFHSDCPPSGATSWIKSLDLNLCTRGGNFTYR